MLNILNSQPKFQNILYFSCFDPYVEISSLNFITM